MLKFIHAADLHLDAPFAALSAADASRRRSEQRLLPRRLARLRAEEGADLVLLSGDLFDGGEIYRETLLALRQAVEEMAVPVFIAPGNHDCYSAKSPYATLSWPENVHIFREETPRTVELPGLRCTVSGAAFTASFRDGSPLGGFSAPRDGRSHLMVLHGDVGGALRYGPIREEEIARSGLTYLALGHVHAFSGLKRAGETVWAYPGCPEGRGFDELGDKGALVGQVDERGNVELRFVPLATRRYQILTVDLTGAADPSAALVDALPRDWGEDVVRIVLRGECPGELDLRALEAVAAPCFAGVSLRDRTTLGRDMWARREEDSLTGYFLQEMERRLAAAESESDRLRVERAVRFGLAALENREEVGA